MTHIQLNDKLLHVTGSFDCKLLLEKETQKVQIYLLEDHTIVAVNIRDVPFVWDGDNQKWKRNMELKIIEE